LIGLATVEVPEPGQSWLVAAGAAVLALFRRRRRA
jgi:PEP-CTERM motif